MRLHSWNVQCPVLLEELAYLKVSHWGFDNKVHMGEIIVHESLAVETLAIFSDLFEKRFPIEKIRLIDEYKGSDVKSMKDNNTSGYNCRVIAGSKNKLSEHSWGMAIDINPLTNPYVKGHIVLPAEGKKYTNRASSQRGLIRKNDDCYNAFVKRGWVWGGAWNNLKDYQHFEK